MRMCLFRATFVALDRQTITTRVKVKFEIQHYGAGPPVGKAGRHLVPSFFTWVASVRTLFALQSMVGSDIAELLMQDCRKLEKYKRQPPVANLITLTDDDWPVLSSGSPNLLTGESPPSVETPAQIVEKFTKLLYYGRKKASAPRQA